MGKIVDFHKVIDVDLDELYIPDEHSFKARTAVNSRMRGAEKKLPLAVVEEFLEYTWEVAYKIIDEFEAKETLTADLKYLIDLFSVIQGERLLYERDKNISYGDYIGDKKRGSKSIIRLHAILDTASSKDPADQSRYLTEWVRALEKVLKMMAGWGIIENLDLTRTGMVDLVYLMTTAYFILEIHSPNK